MPATLYIYVPLHFCCSLHAYLALLQTSIKNQYTATHIYHTTAKYFSSTKYVPQMLQIWHMLKLLCALMKEACQYTTHIWSCSHEWHGLNHCTHNEDNTGWWQWQQCHSPITSTELSTWSIKSKKKKKKKTRQPSTCNFGPYFPES